jgi:tetratricopeptide (TPR) repeat protein
LNLQAFLGATEDGGYAYAELHVSPGAPTRAVTIRVGPDGSAAEDALRPEALERAVAAAKTAGAAQVRSVDAALSFERVPGHERARAMLLPLPPNGLARWSLEPIPGVPCELTLETDAESPGSLGAVLALKGTDPKILLRRLSRAAEGATLGVLVLPGGRRALVLQAAVAGMGSHRTEALTEIELARGVGALLDARAVERLKGGELDKARDDLERAAAFSPDDATVQYNLACAYALSGLPDQALLSLGRAVDLEPERFSAFAREDADLSSLHDRPEFILMVEPRPENP